ncbi:Aminopeptidase-like protein, partial [Operophtera brumata]
NLKAFHIIKTRSIDINNAYGLAMESRLEKSVEPTGYSLSLEPYLDDGYFTGMVRINVTWLEDTDKITVHCGPQLKILEQEVVLLKGDERQLISIRSLEMDVKKPIATVYLERSVPKSSVGYLAFTFRGEFETGSTEAFFKESDLNNKGYLQLAQEISYQWLGAFTTPAWWSDAHLNKALVGYIAAETAFQ